MNPADERRRVTGIGVSPGRAVGVVARMLPPSGEPAAESRLAPGDDAEAAGARVVAAATAVAERLSAAAARAEGTARDVLEATALMAADPSLVAEARRLVTEGRLAPARAVWEAAESVRAQLTALGGYLAERARDVADVRDRIIAELEGRPAPGVPDLAGPAVLVAPDLAPADAATLDPRVVVALVTAGGGPTAHTAIVARALGIPAVVGAADATTLADGETVLVDGSTGTVLVAPGQQEVAQVAAAVRARAERRFDGRGRTGDGHDVALMANVGVPGEAVAAAAAGAQGVGLFRTEFCFLGRADEPSVAEQVAAYREVLAAFPGRRVVVRTLDAGADKPMPFVTPGREPNPALGVRGLRTAARRPEVLDRQLAAIAQAAALETAEVAVMAPMVATVAEAEGFAERCRRHGLAAVGVMVEVPAAALLAGPLLARVEFASLGTNDLAQYVMAADRELADVGALCTPWQPAVLALVAATCRGGRQQGRPVGVCGEAAADPVLAAVLVGLGVSSLSMAPRALPDVAAVLASVRLGECERLAAIALGAEDPDDARARVRAELPQLADLGL